MGGYVTERSVYNSSISLTVQCFAFYLWYNTSVPLTVTRSVDLASQQCAWV
jgi:hypothetical protein